MERIMTKNPDPSKKGTRIEKKRYDIVKKAILDVLKEEGEQSFGDLMDNVGDKLDELEFEGSNGWYFTTVKLDLEARDLIKVDKSGSPQMISL